MRSRLFAVVAVMLTLTACSESTTGKPAAPTDVSKDLTTENVTLNLAYTDDPPTQALIDAFTALHPNVTIKGQQTPFSDYVKSIKLSMASSTRPRSNTKPARSTGRSAVNGAASRATASARAALPSRASVAASSS